MDGYKQVLKSAISYSKQNRSLPQPPFRSKATYRLLPSCLAGRKLLRKWSIAVDPEEVGQLIRRIWANLSTNQIAPFSSCSHEAFGIENLHRAHKYRLFSYCYAHFFGNFTRYYFYNSESTHWNGILKGKRYFPVYFDLSL